MRLLDAQKLELVDVRDDDIPRYAILSHTWGDDEVTLQDVRRMESRMPQAFNKQKQLIADKKGYVKIKNAAAMALKRGLAYIWIDTCCIDKTSSSELSEAINSMYLWYKQATECYAILSDVDPTARKNEQTFMSQLKSSRWFTRGWTLQELIAPAKMHFFARDWTILGQKDTLNDFTALLSLITGIEVEVLDGRVDPAQLSVATRMKWAAQRETTRLEDTAYCLMGIFQVNMPLLYGEGRRAFARLQEEIIRSTDDQSLFAWSISPQDDASEDASDPDALCGLLASSPADFKHAGDMQPLPPLPVYASTPSMMTNLGLRVQLYLCPIDELEGVPMEEDFYAILDTVVRVGERYLCPTITLRRLSVDQFARLRNRPHRFLRPAQPELLSETESYQTVYVRQNPAYYNLPQIRVSPLHSMTTSDRVSSRAFPWSLGQEKQPGLQEADMPRFALVDAFPSSQWNPNTLTMAVKYSRQLRVMALFRFRDTASPGTFDVVLGLRRLDAMQWEGWCFQLSRSSPYYAPPPEFVVNTTNERINQLITKSRKGVISSAALREELGDDPRMMSDATVTGVQQQGRLYVSVSVSLRPETHGQSVDHSRASQVGLDVQEELSKPPRFHSPGSTNRRLNDAARLLTGPCSENLDTLFDEPHEQATVWMKNHGAPLPVRGAPQSSPIDTINAYLRGQRHGPGTAAVRFAVAANAGDVLSMSWLQTSRELIHSATEDEHRLTMLHWAVAGGHDSTVRYLLENGANALSTAKHGLSILHILAIFRQGGPGKESFLPEDELVQQLAGHRTTNFYLETPLHLAAINPENPLRSIGILRKLANLGFAAPRNALDETPVHRAAALNNPGVINTLVPFLPESVNWVDRFGRSPLWHAAATGSHNAVDALIALGALVDLADDLGLGPLHAALRGGHTTCAVKLVKGGADLYSVTVELELTPLDIAAMFGSHIFLDAWLYGAVDSKGMPPHPKWALDRLLHIASSCGRLQCVRSLIRSDADPSVCFEHYFHFDGTTHFVSVASVAGDARHAADLEGHEDVVRFLDNHEARKQQDANPSDSPASVSSPWGFPGGPAPVNQTSPVPPPLRLPSSGQFAPFVGASNPNRYSNNLLPHPSPQGAPGYSTTLPARSSMPSGPNRHPTIKAYHPPSSEQAQLTVNHLWSVDNPPGAYWHPHYGPAGCYFFEMHGQSIDGTSQAIEGLSQGEDVPPLVYVGASGFEKYKRLPMGGFGHCPPEEMADALRQQDVRVRLERERAVRVRREVADPMEQALHLHELDDTQVTSLPEVEQGEGLPPLVYVGSKGFKQYERSLELGSFGFVRRVGAGERARRQGNDKRDVDKEMPRVESDAHQFETITRTRTLAVLKGRLSPGTREQK